MPTPRFKSITINANEKTLVVFYAGRNADGMKSDAHRLFFEVHGSNAIDGGVYEYEYKEEHFNAKGDGYTRFLETISNWRETNEVKYTEKVEGIGERWLVIPKPLQVEEDTTGAIFGGNENNTTPPSLDGFGVDSNGVYVDDNGAPLNPMLDDNLIAAIEASGQPGEEAPVDYETLDDLKPEEESITQHHEIITDHGDFKTRTIFDTEGPPDWGDNPVPEGYRRIQEKPEVSIGIEGTKKIESDPDAEEDIHGENSPVAGRLDYIQPNTTVDHPFVNHDAVEGGIKYDPELIEPSVLSGEPGSERPKWFPEDFKAPRMVRPRDPLFEPRHAQAEDLGRGVPDSGYPYTPMFDTMDIIVGEEKPRPVSAVHGLPYDEGELSKGDPRYFAEDKQPGGVNAFGPSEYERARNNIRSIEWKDDEEMILVSSSDTPKEEEKPDKKDKEQIDTGKLRDPRNMEREMEELIKDPNTADLGERKTSPRIPPPGRRSRSFFGTVR